MSQVLGMVAFYGVTHGVSVLAQGQPPTIGLDTFFNNSRILLISVLGGLTGLNLTIAAIRYANARDKPEEVAKAKAIFWTSMIGFGAAMLVPNAVPIFKWLFGVQ